MNAEAFVQRSLIETEQWLNRIEELANAGELDTEKLSALVNSWKTTIGVGRSSFRLDEQPEEMLVNVIQMSNAVCRPIDPAIDMVSSEHHSRVREVQIKTFGAEREGAASQVQSFGFHDLRRHFISYAVMSGVDFMTSWLGHKDGVIGKVYGHLLLRSSA